jgi:hypothetical protein
MMTKITQFEPGSIEQRRKLVGRLIGNILLPRRRSVRRPSPAFPEIRLSEAMIARSSVLERPIRRPSARRIGPGFRPDSDLSHHIYGTIVFLVGQR